MACLQFLGNWVTPTAPCLPSIRALQNGGSALKRVFLPQKTVRVLFSQRRQTQPDNPWALHQWAGGVLERSTFDLELVHKTGKLFNATHLRVSVDGRNNTDLLRKRLLDSSETYTRTLTDNVPMHIKHRQNHNCIRGNRPHLAGTNINPCYLTAQYGL